MIKGRASNMKELMINNPNKIKIKITCDDESMTINRFGVMSFLAHGLKGNKKIFLENISSVEFKKVIGPICGFIQFTIQGGIEGAFPLRMKI